MNEVELKNTSIYQAILHALYQNVPLSKGSVETMIMPTIIDFIQGYYNLECELKKAYQTGSNTIVVHSDNFVREKFIEKACEYLKSLTCQEFAGAQPERVMDDYDIEQFKKYMEE